MQQRRIGPGQLVLGIAGHVQHPHSGPRHAELLRQLAAPFDGDVVAAAMEDERRYRDRRKHIGDVDVPAELDQGASHGRTGRGALEYTE